MASSAQVVRDRFCRQFDESQDTLNDLLDEQDDAKRALRRARTKGQVQRRAAEERLAEATAQLHAFKKSPPFQQQLAEMRQLLLQFPELAPKYGAAAPSLTQVAIWFGWEGEGR